MHEYDIKQQKMMTTYDNDFDCNGGKRIDKKKFMKISEKK